MRKILIVAALALAAAPGGFALADEAEQQELARQQAFQAGMQEIVDSLNTGSTDRFVAAINEREFMERIFGLRLIDQKVKKSFRESMEQNFRNMVSMTFADSKDNLKATLLGVESRGTRGRAVVRFTPPTTDGRWARFMLLSTVWSART